jgi:hypothetical protein
MLTAGVERKVPGHGAGRSGDARRPALGEDAVFAEPIAEYRVNSQVGHEQVAGDRIEADLVRVRARLPDRVDTRSLVLDVAGHRSQPSAGFPREDGHRAGVVVGHDDERLRRI